MNRWLALFILACMAAAGTRAAVVLDATTEEPDTVSGRDAWRMGLPELDATNALSRMIKAANPDRSPAALLESARKAVQTEPLNPRSHYQLGNVLLQANRLDEAASAFWQACRLEPGSATALESLGFTLLTLGDHANGLLVYQKLETMTRAQPRLKLNLAAAYYGLGRYNDAVLVLADYLVQNPDQPKALYNLGLAQLAAGRYPEAIKSLEQVREAMPGNLFVLCGLLRAYEKSGDRTRAADLKAELIATGGAQDVEALLAAEQLPVFISRQ